MEKKPDAEYKTGKATVRIHGTADREKVKAATERYLKRLEVKKCTAAQTAARS